MSSSDNFQAETIEVVPELPFSNDSEEEFSEFSEENGETNSIENTFSVPAGDDDDYDDDNEPFDEYAYQVNTNHYEPDTVWCDNSQTKKMKFDASADSGVIEIDSDDDDEFNDDFDEEDSTSGLPIDENSDETGEKANTCDICHRKVASSYNLKRHMMIHTGEKPFKCDVCGHRFREFSDLKKHRKIHNGEKLFNCPSCHQNRPINKNSIKCVVCEKSDAARKVQTVTNQSAQLPRFDGNNKRSFICSYCNRSFGSSSNLKRHIMIHTGEKPFKCPICKRAFREMSTLKKHSFTHRKENGFSFKAIDSFETQAKTFVGSSTNMNNEIVKQQLPQKSYHTCPICKEKCLGSRALIEHCFKHKQPIKENSTGQISVRKFAKSPPPLIPINRAAFKLVKNNNNKYGNK